MNKFIKAAVLTVAAAASVLPTLSTAQADDWGRRGYYRHDRHRGGDAAALGALGLATGLIVGGALANNQPRGRVYIDPPYDDGYYEERRVYRRPPPPPIRRVYQGSLEPWTGPWYRYCSQRYRSFDPGSGTFVGYDGRSYFCTAG